MKYENIDSAKFRKGRSAFKRAKASYAMAMTFRDFRAVDDELINAMIVPRDDGESRTMLMDLLLSRQLTAKAPAIKLIEVLFAFTLNVLRFEFQWEDIPVELAPGWDFAISPDAVADRLEEAETWEEKIEALRTVFSFDLGGMPSRGRQYCVLTKVRTCLYCLASKHDKRALALANALRPKLLRLLEILEAEDIPVSFRRPLMQVDIDEIVAEARRA